MNTDRKALLWGSVIGFSLVAAMMVLAFRFPHFRMPFTSSQVNTFLVGGFLFGLLIASYRALWKYRGFWALLLAFLTAHIVLYWLLIAKISESLAGLRLDAFYGITSGVEYVIFALLVARLYHRGPDTSSFTRNKAR